jgi:hypothetical protein
MITRSARGGSVHGGTGNVLVPRVPRPAEWREATLAKDDSFFPRCPSSLGSAVCRREKSNGPFPPACSLARIK